MVATGPQQQSRGAWNPESGQAAVETALILPLQLFMLLGGLQLAMLFQARLVAEHAAYRATRAASLYRGDCRHTVDAALTALLPLMPGRASGGSAAARVQSRYSDAARRIIGVNKAPGVDVPLVLIDTQLTGRRDHFDDQLELSERPMRMQVRLITLQELGIPFGGWLISRWWLASVSTADALRGVDPLIPTRQAKTAPATTYDREVVDFIRKGHEAGYYALPIVTTFTLRMMSDPRPGLATAQRCR